MYSASRFGKGETKTIRRYLKYCLLLHLRWNSPNMGQNPSDGKLWTKPQWCNFMSFCRVTCDAEFHHLGSALFIWLLIKKVDPPGGVSVSHVKLGYWNTTPTCVYTRSFGMFWLRLNEFHLLYSPQTATIPRSRQETATGGLCLSIFIYWLRAAHNRDSNSIKCPPWLSIPPPLFFYRSMTWSTFPTQMKEPYSTITVDFSIPIGHCCRD